ncbi:conserved hypothetical protein [Neospora caninum Liverpool]|uniref:Alpha/beta hydrolase family protein n=1 Tax=Neospora caninum (strain Liverpool) TaxID=572307 RepID=F0VNV8_NEOCL|nr:conserved hypothetical protein [Neospora caninum Liverpool]CBZ55404.1 conserved hypothetical protein [Neospora caninum Liverpool]CEL70140.1 TPA: hypothetical protein BN1204_058270 [Neospora caninum Liverpool]|eukprot:XP_003885432.1 conserved hypothetical protein [Neospora caninum Liverpool]
MAPVSEASTGSSARQGRAGGSRGGTALPAASSSLSRRQPRRTPLVSSACDESSWLKENLSCTKNDASSPEDVSGASTECVASVPSSAYPSDAESWSTASGIAQKVRMDDRALRRASRSPGQGNTKAAWAPHTGQESVGDARGQPGGLSNASFSPASFEETVADLRETARLTFASVSSASSSRSTALAAFSPASSAASRDTSDELPPVPAPANDEGKRRSVEGEFGAFPSQRDWTLSGGGFIHSSPSLTSQQEGASAMASLPVAFAAAAPLHSEESAALTQQVVGGFRRAASVGAGICTPQKQAKPKRHARPVRACPQALARREIPTKPLRSLDAKVLYKYRAPGGAGIQVPALRLESAPTKLSNWRFSWQEVLCYNPRAYTATPQFKENYLVMRAGIESFVASMTDLVFVDRNSAHLNPAYVYHAYLLPPVCPHNFHAAACIQCYTSDDGWLSRGAWKRVRHPNGSAETLQPTNPLLIPFRPAETLEERKQFHFQFRQKAFHPLYEDTSVGACSSGTGDGASQAKKLPLHLWILLGGKDMQALDGIVVAWKFLRFASEIPPSEFVECPGEATVSGCAETPTGSLFWGVNRNSGQRQYHQYHSAGRNPTQDQTCEAADESQKSTGRSFSPFGPFLYDMKGVTEDKKYRVSFLMVDIPGYGNSSGHPSPDTIRSCVLQAVKHALMELVDQHGEDSVIINILGYSLGCAVALALAADLAECIYNDLPFARVSPSRTFRSPAPAASGKKIATASRLWEERMKSSKWEAQHPAGEGADGKNSKVHSGVTFGKENLTLRDTCNVALNQDAESPRVVPLHEDYLGDADKPDGLRLAVNRLVLLAPFTSIQAMASRVAAATVGGGGLISRAASALVSRQINWDNEASMKRLFEVMSKIGKTTQSDIFRNFRLYIEHGDKDSVIPWTMGYELFTLAKSLRAALNMPYIPLKFSKLAGESHATILSGQSELPLLESCFAPYRLHPASPLALLKFYSRITHLPTPNPPRRDAMPPGVYAQSGLVRRVPVAAASTFPSKTVVISRQNTSPALPSLAATLSRSSTLEMLSVSQAAPSRQPDVGSDRRLRYSTSDSFLVPENPGTSQRAPSAAVSPARQYTSTSTVSRRAESSAGEVHDSHSPAYSSYPLVRAASGLLPSGASDLSRVSGFQRSSASPAGTHPRQGNGEGTAFVGLPTGSGTATRQLPPVPTPTLNRANTTMSVLLLGSNQTPQPLGSQKPSLLTSVSLQAPGPVGHSTLLARSASLTSMSAQLNRCFSVGN